MQETPEFNYENNLNCFSSDERKIIDTVLQVGDQEEIQRFFNKGIEELRNACRLHIEFNHAKPKLSIVHSKDDDIIPSSEAYKLKSAFKDQTKVKILVTALFDHADMKLNMKTLVEFLKLCRMIHFVW